MAEPVGRCCRLSSISDRSSLSWPGADDLANVTMVASMVERYCSARRAASDGASLRRRSPTPRVLDMRVLNRQRRSVLGTDNQRVLVDVLDLLNNSADAIGNALVPGRAGDAARHLRRLMDTPAVAITDLVHVLACDGVATVDREVLMRVVAPALASARSRVITLDGMLEPIIAKVS
jgi:hypothetical protein